MLRILLLALIVFLMSGCSTRGLKTTQSKSQKNYTKTNQAIPKHTTDPIHNALVDAYEKYNGAQYAYGGSDLNGIDCSSLTQNIYFDAFGMRIPRTTEALSTYGKPIESSQMRSGDLIFFTISENLLHVGIVIEEQRFIHASTTKGVMVSEIFHPYWREHYWQTRRILPLR